MWSFYGRILVVDLTEQRYRISPVSDRILSTYLGGKGLASHLLLTHAPGGAAPLSPENCLIFATGPMTNSLVWGSSRYGVFTKSPQTGIYAESYAGGRVPEAIDAAGFDAIVLTGRLARPSVLVIDPDGVKFHSAGNIWGLDTMETEAAVNHAFGIPRTGNVKSGAVVIGPAGENRVRFAIIANDAYHSAGRTGVGTVMGAKNLKAIVFQGDRRRPVFDPEGLKQFAKAEVRLAKTNPAISLFRSKGTPKMVTAINRFQAFPSRYWSANTRKGWQQLTAEALNEHCQVTPQACAKCYIGCGRLTTVQHGRHAGLTIGGPEYETIFAFGGLCLVDSLEEIAYLNDICDRLGMDTISAGNLCGFAIEAARRGKIATAIDYGDVDAMADLLKQIARREDVGGILARGIRYAAKRWDMESVAVHVKGLEPPGYDPRVLKGSGLGFAVSDRGACHLRATFHRPELNGTIHPEDLSGKAAALIDYEDRLTLMDTFILCRFYRDLYPWDKLAKLVHLTTGLPEDTGMLRKLAGNIASQVRSFSIREGLTSAADHLPPRLYKETLKTGHRIAREDMEGMVQDYYSLRGWDPTGRPETG